MDHAHPKQPRGANAGASGVNNQGSHFKVLADEMEIEMEDKAEEEKIYGKGVEGDRSGSPMDMEAPNEGEQESRSVTVPVSHAGLTENLRLLKATNVNIRIQAQGAVGDPRKTADKTLKDLTNKINNKPALAKASRPIMKVSGAMQKENVKILKRAEHALKSEIGGLPVGGQAEIAIRIKRAEGLDRVGTARPTHQTPIRTGGRFLKALALIFITKNWGEMGRRRLRRWRQRRPKMSRWRRLRQRQEQ